MMLDSASIYIRLLTIHREDIGLFLEALWALLMSTLSGANLACFGNSMF